ncbi:MAG: ABC transporter ATP-binding protein [Ruminococcaceae bacterium]|nr:ABC transporter ATP-binding protein [Oscillospiraceae bacterium]
MKWIIKKSKFILPGVAVLTLTGMLVSLMGVVFALLSKGVLDIATKQAEGDLLRAGVVLFAFLIFQLLLEIFQSFLNVYITGKFNVRFKSGLFQTILKKDYLKITEYHTGELMNRISSDVGIVATGLIQMLPQLIFYLTKIVACFFALYFLDPAFALLCLALGPLIFITAYIYRKKMKNLHKSCQAADGAAKSFMQETLKNMLVIKSFGCSSQAAGRSEFLLTKLFKLNLKRNRLSIMANVFFYVGLTAGYYVALAWGAYKIANGMITFGTLTALLQLVSQIQAPFQGLSALFPQYYSMVASAERLMELEKLPEDPIDAKAEWDEEDWASINLQHISFAYRDEKVLEQSDFSVKKGEFVVITGTSGTGKSTLLKIMLGILKPQSGTANLVMEDGTERALETEKKQLFSYVPQGNLIVSGSIRDNVLFFKTDISDEDVIEALKDAQIWEFIETLPEGLDTELGEGGLGLSEGQIQRLAVARAILHGAPVLLLDEATSALDEATELAILAALKARKDKTCILVSHKKAALEVCDKVFHVENGKLIPGEEK